MAHRKVGVPPDEALEYLIRWENRSNLQVTWEPTSSLLFAPKKLRQYHKKDRDPKIHAVHAIGFAQLVQNQKSSIDLR